MTAQTTRHPPQPHAHDAECKWEVPVNKTASASISSGQSPENTTLSIVHLATTIRRGAHLSASIASNSSNGAAVAVVVLDSPLSADTSSVHIASGRPLLVSDILKVFTSHNSPLQPAGATVCISEQIQQV